MGHPRVPSDRKHGDPTDDCPNCDGPQTWLQTGKNWRRYCTWCETKRAMKNQTPDNYGHRLNTKNTRNQQKKREFIEYLGGACHDCGANHFPDAAYDIHHTKPELKTNTPQRLTMQRDKAELDTCHVLCAVCHRVRHAENDLDGRKYRRANPR